MAQAAESISPKESRLGGLSLFCLAVGVVGPFLDTLAAAMVNTGGPLAGVDPVAVAMGLRVVFLVPALVLGILSRRSRAGRVGLIGSAVTLGIGLLLVAVLFSRHAAHAVPSPLSPPAP
jgi:hypothetical protein